MAMTTAKIDAAIRGMVECPKPPNFVRIKGVDTMVPVGVLSDAAVDDLARRWAEAIKRRGREQRQGNPG